MSFIFGNIAGSFLNVVILRLPRDEKLTGRSHCFNCRHNLQVLDLVPLFSYLFLLGKCRYCGRKISPRYFIIEFLTGLLFALCFWLVNPASVAGLILLLKDFIFIAAMLAVFMVDLEHFLILDSVIFPIGVIILILNLVLDFLGHNFLFSPHSNFLGGLIAAAGAALPFFLIWYFSQGRWMGFGDVKLALFLGLALGWPQVFVSLMLGVISGGLISAGLLIFTNNTLKSRLPFGTFLSFGALISLFYGDKLLSWYLGFLGF